MTFGGYTLDEYKGFADQTEAKVETPDLKADATKAFAVGADLTYKYNLFKGGAVWKYATFGFGDMAIQQVAKQASYAKLRGILKNDGLEVTDVSGKGDPAWKLTNKEGAVSFIHPDRVVRGSQVNNLAELMAKFGPVPHTISADDQLGYNIGGMIGAFSRMSGKIGQVTKRLPIYQASATWLKRTASTLGERTEIGRASCRERV